LFHCVARKENYRTRMLHTGRICFANSSVILQALIKCLPSAWSCIEYVFPQGGPRIARIAWRARLQIFVNILQQSKSVTLNSTFNQLVPYDAVNRNKVSIRQLPLFIFLLTHYMFRPLRAILRRDIQLDVFKDYSYYNGSVARTQLDVEMLHVLHRYFDPWYPIHVVSEKENKRGSWRIETLLRLTAS
jgi:hypothetical protein